VSKFCYQKQKGVTTLTQKRMGKSTRSRNSQEEDLAYDTPERKRPNVANDGAAAAAAAATNARRIDGGAGNRGTVYYKYKFEPF
jgi:hypothetical protein